jgi:O-antigen ligase
VNASRIIVVFGLWLIVSLICNDKTDYGVIRVGINIGPDRILYGILLVEFLRQYRQFGRSVRWLAEEKLMMVFFFILLVSCFVYGAAFARNNRYLSKLFNFSIVPATLFMMSRRLTYDRRSLRIFGVFCLIIGLYLGFTGVGEHYQLDALVFPRCILDPDFGIHFGRVRGPFGNAAVMGGALIVVGLWILWGHTNLRKSRLTWVALLPMLASIYWTNTRGVWLQLAASMGILSLARNPLRRPIRVSILLVAVIFFSGLASKFSAYQRTLFEKRPEQVDDRINIYHASWRMFLERPVFGFGYGNFLKYCENYFEELPGVELRGQHEGQHNTILGLMCETGIVGTIPYCLVYLMFFRTCYRRFQNAEAGDELGKSIALMQLSILAGNVVAMQFSDFGFYNYLNNLTFWSTAMVYAKFKRSASSETQESLKSQGESLPPELAHA